LIGSWRRFVLDTGIQRKTIRQAQSHTTRHLRLEPLQLGHSSLKYSRVLEVLNPDRSIEHVYTAWVGELELAPGRKGSLGGFLDVTDTGLVEDAIQEDDDVAVYEAVAFDVQFCDVPAVWLE
jgi:hypothetical protein